MLPPSLEMLAAVIGVLKSGAAYVPLDPAYPSERLRSIIAQAQPALVLSDSGLSGPVLPGDLPVVAIDELPDPSADLSDPDVQIDPADLCYLMFTSGSTGIPNGVLVTHGNVAGLFANLPEQFALSSGDNWSAMHSFAFGFSVWEIWGALSTGACLTIIPAELRNDPVRWSRLLVEQGVSVLSVTPSAFRQWLLSDQLPGAAALQSLRLIVFSGEAVHAEDLQAWYEHCRQLGESPGPQLVNTYALTETAGRITTRFYAPEAVADAANIGLPTADAEVFVLAAAPGRQAAVGETGELVVSGPMVANGYLDNGAAVAGNERFVTLDPGDGLARRCYRTGDRARLNADGSISFAGRGDEQIKLRGYRIDLRDIEQTLRRHPAVRDAAVVLQQQGAAEQLVAWVVPAATAEVEFWPSLGEYQIYDDLLYDFMSSDEVRVAAYQRAFERKVKDKVVLDIGTGKDAILARLCAAAGARKVYAVEVLADACAHARQLIQELGLQDRVVVMQGDMRSIDLPEPVDVCTQGIIGNIGSSDGIVPIWNDARRWFAESYAAVPARCETLFAPAMLPQQARSNPGFGALAAAYTERIFAAAGAPFDVRLCVRNFPLENLLAAPALFEDLDFQADLQADYRGSTSFTVSQSGSFDGFLLWTRVHTDEFEQVDFLQHQQAWLPVWFPVVDGGIDIQAGDRIEARWRCLVPDGQIFPDYIVDVDVQRATGDPISYSYTSKHFEVAYQQTELHRRLFASRTAVDTEPLPRQLHEWLQAQLPAQMLPGHWELIERLPLTANGKLDRRALAEVELAQPSRTASFVDPFEADIAAIWASVLGRDSIGRDEDFFAAGGDSILAVRLTTEVQRYLDDTVFLAALFEAPTIASYSNWLTEHHASAAARRSAASATVNPAEQAESGVIVPAPAGPTDLSWPQQSLWFLHQLYPHNTAANEQFLIRVAGGSSPQQLREAWHAVLASHDILRTRFSAATASPQQLVESVAACIAHDATPLHDFAALSAELATERLVACAAADIRQPFDLSVAPLLRTRIIRLPSNELVLLVTAHHIIADGLCVQLVRDELARFYKVGSLQRPELQYADFAYWQTHVLSAAAVAADVQWWLEQLADHDGQPVVAAGASVSAAAREHRLAFTIDSELGDQLRALAAEQGATPFMFLLAAWRVWLQRCFGSQDLLLGSPMTMRRDQQTAAMLGCLVNNLVFRNPVADDANFIAVLQAEKAGALAAYDHATAPFEKVVEALQPQRLVGRHPLFQLMFMFEDRSAPAIEHAGMRFSSDVLPVDRASYWDLELSVTDCGVGQPLPAFIGVREDLFDCLAATSWTESFSAMLAALVANPQQPVATLPLLSQSQQQLVLHDWNAAALALPVAAEATLHGCVAAQIHRTPAAVAVSDEHETLTYAALDARATAYAAGLQAQGIEPGQRVGLCVARSADAIALLLAILRCGAAWLPLDPGYPRQRLQQMLTDAAPDLVVATETLEFLPCPLISPADLRLCGAGQTVAASACSGVSPAYLLFTSGSTGRPKGSVALHAGAVSRCQWMWNAYDFTPEEIFTQRTSLNFVDSIWEIFGPLMHGAQVCILPERLAHDAAGMTFWLAERQVSHLVVVPTLLSGILNALSSQITAVSLASLRSVISSGEPLTAELARRFRTALPTTRLLNTYGTSETWDVSCHEVSDADIAANALGSIAIGRPVANARAYVLDRRLQPLPPGMTGELCVGGLALAEGYLGHPELTRERFVADPFVPGARMYRSGDLAQASIDGNLLLRGRIDRQLKLRGLRIEAHEIEAVAEQFAGVDKAAVVQRAATGQDAWLALYVEAQAAFDPQQLREHLRSRLPRAMVPADIYPIAHLPLTPSGKLDVNALPEYTPVAREIAAPRTELEAALAAIWMEALGLTTLGIHDDFFALRGHSLLATQVIARISESQGVELPLASIFETPTIAGLARSIEALRWTQPAAGTPHDGADDEREVMRL